MDTFYSVSLLTILMLLCFVLWYCHLSNTQTKNFPPGPKDLPVIGNRIVVHRDYKKLSEFGVKYKGLFSLHLFGVQFIVVSDWKLIKEALVGQSEIFSGRSKMHVMKQVTRFNDISMSYGPGWKQKKMKVVQFLRSFGFGKPTMEKVILDEITKLFEVFDKHIGKPVEMTECFFMPVLNIIWGIVTGKTYQYDDEQMKLMKERIQLHLSLITSTMLVNAIPWLRFLPFDPFGYHLLIRNVCQIYRYLDSVVHEHKKSLDYQSEPRDFIDLYLAEISNNNRDKQPQFQFLSGVIFNLLIAGIETTKSTLEYSLMYMAKWPHIQKKVQEELDSHIGTGRMPTYADLAQMPYTDATILEIHRYTSILPLSVIHRAVETTTLGGYIIPEDTLMFTNIWAVHHDKKLWGDPEVFRPERFLDADGKVQKPDYLMHFGLGSRSCLGSSVARIELFLFFASLLQRYSFANVSEEAIPSLNPVSRESLTQIPKRFQLIVKER